MTEMAMLKLSKRLEMVASFVPRGSSVADIGTDHGYVPIELVRRGTASGAIAMDVRHGPLMRAKAHVKEAGLEAFIEVRLSDGLKRLEPGEADCVIIAGMGGDLMIHIMEEGHRLWKDMKYWVLSPQSHQEKVRRFLLEHSFTIRRDRMLKEDGKFYTVLAVTRENGPEKPEGEDCERAAGEELKEAAGKEGQSVEEKERPVKEAGLWRPFHFRYGLHSIREKDSVLLEFLETEAHMLKQIMKTLERSKTPAAANRLAELERKLRCNKEAQDEMQRDHTGS